MTHSAKHGSSGLRLLAVLTCAFALTACGGGGGAANGGSGGSVPPTAPITPAVPTTPAAPSPPVPADDAPTLITLASEPGDSIAQGKSYRYGVVSAVITLTATGNQLGVEIEGEERWSGVFRLPDTLTTLQTGHYESKTGWPTHDPALGGVRWGGEGNGCTAQAGTIDIDKISFAGNALRSIEMRFAQFCNGASGPALRGTIRWVADDPTPRILPLAIPDSLWRAPSAAVPGSGNYVYVTGDAQHFIAEGDTFLYKSAEAALSFSTRDRGIQVAVTANERWDMMFVPMAPQTKLLPGYYAFISGKTNPAFGYMTIGGGRDNHGCERDTGWFAVDTAEYSGAQLTALDLRFEMACGALQGTMHGQLHWRAGDPSQPAGPVNPMPAGLWTPPANVLPASGNGFYLESDAGDKVGRGQTVVHTNADAQFMPSRNASGIWFSVNGDMWWQGMFLPMSGLTRLEPGYYGNLSSNHALGSVLMSNELYNCQSGITGWFAVDSVSYNSAGDMTSIDLRFEQRCNESSGSAMRGRLRWSATDLTRPTPPVNPPPSNLWAPAASAVPAAGNYVYLESSAQDYIGAGRNYLYTTNNAVFSIDRGQFIAVQGDEKWRGDLRYIYSDTGWKPGYYAKTRKAGNSAARGSLSWSGENRGCNVSDGWIVVDSVHYDATGLHDIELRFEQYCDTSPTPLHGKLRWNRDDLSQPPGPVTPPPSSLWTAPASRLPSIGSYVYIESDATDYIGSGNSNQAHTYVYPLVADRTLNYSTPSAIDFRFESAGDAWFITASPMISLSQLLPGYYPDTQRDVVNNPAKGGLSVMGFSRGCNTSHGWYVIDAIRFENGKMTQLDMRFEQRCDEGAGGSLRGMIHWTP